MTAPESPESRPACSLRRLVLGPALVTLGVTSIRLGLELAHAPDWLASRKAGGGGALLGIAWLPIFVGPWFASRLRRPGDTTWTATKRLVKTLVVYGWSARLPVIAVTFLAVAMGWETHFNNFGPDHPQPSTTQIVLVTLGSQLVFWSMIWTPIVGGIAGLAWRRMTRDRAGDAVERPATAA
jgi:hypothetical protein